MKTQYTKKQIREAIAYWEKQLKQMDEAASKSVDPDTRRPALTNIQDLMDECQRFVEMGFGRTRIYLDVDGKDVKLGSFRIEVIKSKPQKAVLHFSPAK